MNEIHPIQSETTLADLAKEIWRGRGFVLGGAVCGLAIAFLFIMMAVPHSRAQMVLSPASPMEASAKDQNSKPDVASQNMQAALNFERFQSVAKGAAVASLLLRSPELVKGLEYDQSFLFSKPVTNWRPENLAEYISRRVQFVPVGETPLRILRYSHRDAKFAAAFLQRLHAITDGVIRHSVRTEVNERIGYLQQEMQRSMNPEHRRAMTDLLMEQERLRMLVSIDQPYAALVIEPAFSSSKALWPDKMLVFSSFAALGAFLGFVFFSLTHAQLRAPMGFQEDDGYNTAEAQRAKERLKNMKRWSSNAPPQNANERPLTGKGTRKRNFSSDAAE
jgi:uncharacterized protein involved in exopolysaccharide biosynthesis